MKKILVAIIILITCGQNADSQTFAITIAGPSPVWEGSDVIYLIRPIGSLPANTALNAVVTAGTIIDQNLDPYNGQNLFIRVLWGCSRTAGDITVTKTSTATSFTKAVTILTYATYPTFCKETFPVYQELPLSQAPTVLAVDNCSHLCASTSFYSYQWQVGSLSPGQSEPFYYADIPGATELTYQPPVQTTYQSNAYRRKTSFISIDPNNGLQFNQVYSNTAIVGYFEPLAAGNIYGGGFIEYGTLPVITSTPASAGNCSDLNGYVYTWEYAANGSGNWLTLGTGEAYPNMPVLGHWSIRRKATCGPAVAYSNIINFSLIEFDPGTISGGGVVAVNTVPVVGQTPATGGNCLAANYQYTWQRSVDEAPWMDFGTGAAYPATVPIYGNTAIRRKVKCGTEEKYSNYSWFSIPPYTSPNAEDKNYVRTNTILVPGLGGWPHADNLPTGEKIQSTTYFDGLSRPIQKVTREVSEVQPNTWADMVSFTAYDAAGRAPRSYLPYPDAANIGKYKANPLTAQQAFISSAYAEPVGAPAFSAVTFDNSPLNRVLTGKEAGAGWGGNPAYSGNSMQYEFNTQAEGIKIWSIGYGETDMPEVTGVYSNGKLSKSVLVDENQKKVYEYKDLSGNTILKKVQLENTVDENGYNGWLCTYYVYDDMGQLRSTVTPKAVNFLRANNWSFINNRDVYNELCFYNYFDERGRTIIKHSAGAGEIQLVYDKRNRLVLSQDENQRNRSTKQWSFYLYDIENRQVANGLLDNNSAARAQYQAYVDGLNNGNIALTLFTGQNETIVAHNPVAGNALLGNGAGNLVVNAVSYYDNYSYAGAKPFSSNFSFAATGASYIEPPEKTANTLALATGSKVRVIDEAHDDGNPANDKFLTSTSYYDAKGRTLQGLTDNIKGGTDYVTIQYDFAGKTHSVCEKQNFTGTGYTNFTVITRLEYNRIGQTLSVSKKYQDQPYKKLAGFTYDAMGRMKVKKLSPDFNNGAGIESLQYDYNLHGALTGINKEYALTSSSLAQWDHYFGSYMGYDNRDGRFTNARYDGNLTGILWKGQGDNSPRRYDYVYDNAGRLTAANFTQKEKPTDASWTNAAVDFSMTNVSYDENGNLAAMFQKGILPGKTAPIFVDKLTYTYKTVGGGQWSNKLAGVIDNTTDLGQANNGMLGDFKDEAYRTGGIDYEYDGNGNMVKDNNKKIRVSGGNGITYNYMDKPQKVIIEGKSITEFIYDATGDKIGKKLTNTVTGQVTTTWYNGSFVYEQTTAGTRLQYIGHEEGRVRVFTPVTDQPRLTLGNNFDLPDGQKGVFEFFVKDHLQNTRAILSEETHIEQHNCTMETTDANVVSYEQSIFGNEVGTTRVVKANDAYAQGWTGNTSTKVSKLPAAAGGKGSVGPNMMLKVMAGDKLHLKVDYYFNQPVANGNNSVLTPVAGIITGLLNNGTQASGPVHGAAGTDINAALTSNSGALNQFLKGNDNSQSTNPRAYLNYIFFDENFKFVPYDNVTGLGSYAQPVTTPGNGQQINRPNVMVPKNGYVFIYLSNNSNINVYFDNLDIRHDRGRLVEENAYYPYGLKIKSISGKAYGKLANSYGYHGDYAEEDEETAWNEFDLRMYNPQIGRWNGADPYDQFASPYLGLGGNPVNTIDEDGGFAGWIGASIGAAVFGTTAYLIASNNGIKGAGFIAAGAAILGAGVGYGVDMSLFNGASSTASFGANFRAFYLGLIGRGGEFANTTRSSVMDQGGYALSPDIWQFGHLSSVSYELANIITNIDLPTRLLSARRLTGLIETTLPSLNIITDRKLSSRKTSDVRLGMKKKVSVERIPFSFCANDDYVGSDYYSDEISEEQMLAVNSLGKQFATISRPSDQVSASLTQQDAIPDKPGSEFQWSRALNFVPHPLAGGSQMYNIKTGLRVNNYNAAAGYKPVKVGLTVGESYSGQTASMAARLGRRLGIKVTPKPMIWKPNGGCRYRFSGTITRHIVTWSFSSN